jgi:penicillin amidase
VTRRQKFVLYGSIAVLALLMVSAAAIYSALRASLPQIEGEIVASDLDAPVTVERDELGTPTIRATSRRDLAFATGFAHAQDRFFQMDLMRRAATGRLAALLGDAVLDTDQRLRVHGFEQVAAEVVRSAPESDREVLGAYVEGVNFALAKAEGRPWEYLLLRSQPEPWRIEDSVLVAFSMYLNLNDSSGEEELTRAWLHETLPAPLFSFLHPLGTEWDAPVTGGVWQPAPMPGPETVDLRATSARVAATAVETDLEEKQFAGSNSWAVAGSHSENGGALLANDMHLGLRLPHVWYRARLIVESSSEAPRDLVGVTLPGLPMLIAGSNGKVAWGFTNSYGDWTDLVVVEADPQDANRYLTPEGSEPFTVREETFEVRGGEAVKFTIKSTRWGPIVSQDASGRPLALAWTAHDPRATNVRMIDFETAGDLETALAVGNRAGTPVQNLLVADSTGRIGWSLMGQVPVRANYDSTLVTSWRAPETGWTGWREESDYPRLVDPPAGRMWTANARTIEVSDWLQFMGDGGYDLGARAAQIRDGLLARPKASAADMLAIQVDDRALFLTRWRDLLLELLNESATRDHAARAQARQLMQQWSGRAAADDAGYRIVRALRLQIRKDVFTSLTGPARAKYPKAKFSPSAQFEGPLWQVVTQRPMHLLDPSYESWDAALLASVDRALEELQQACAELSKCTWGAENTLRMQHPLSGALPFASRWLNMPEQQLPGDSQMPRVQGVRFGASQRLVVSPGRESEGFFQMPGGPVDHPLSPFYGAGHEAWVKGEPAPLLPGPARHTLNLRPAAKL